MASLIASLEPLVTRHGTIIITVSVPSRSVIRILIASLLLLLLLLLLLPILLPIIVGSFHICFPLYCPVISSFVALLGLVMPACPSTLPPRRCFMSSASLLLLDFCQDTHCLNRLQTWCSPSIINFMSSIMMWLVKGLVQDLEKNRSSGNYG